MIYILTPNSGQFSYLLPNIVSFLFRLEFRFRSRDFSFNIISGLAAILFEDFEVPYLVHIHTSTINAPELRERISFRSGAMFMLVKHC
jgi:hypothetical protein